MTFELGVYSFGNTPRTADGGYGPTAHAVRNALEAAGTSRRPSARSPPATGT